MNEIQLKQAKANLDSIKTTATKGVRSTADLTPIIEQIQIVLECQQGLHEKIDSVNESLADKFDQVHDKVIEMDQKSIETKINLNNHIARENEVAADIKEIKNTLIDPNNGLVVRVNKIEEQHRTEKTLEGKEEAQKIREADIAREQKNQRNWQLIGVVAILVLLLGEKAYPYAIKLLALFF